MMNDNKTWRPSYWKDDTHGSGWDRAKEALKRDWEQTKADFSKTAGKELNQDVGDTVKQAVGAEKIPAPNTPNPESTKWEDVEPAVAYGYGASKEYGAKYSKWDNDLETKLKTEWDKDKTGRSFDDVKRNIRTGWDYKS